MLKIDYNHYANNFNQTLISDLRKHGSTEEYLQLWVPDDNIVIGMAGMVDSVIASGIKHFQIEILKESISKKKVNEFLEQIKSLVRCNQNESSDKYTFEFSLSHVKIDHELGKLKTKSPKAAKNKKEKIKKHSVKKKRIFLIHTKLKNSALALTLRFDHKKLANNFSEDLQIKGKNYCIFIHVSKEGVVKDIAFSASKEKWKNAILELYCELGLNLPIQELIDHNILKIIYRLNANVNTKLVSGVLLPSNCGLFFTQLNALGRKAYNNWKDENLILSSTNTYIVPPVKAWQDENHEFLLDQIKKSVSDYYKSQSLEFSKMISSVRLEKNKSNFLSRIVIQYTNNYINNRSIDLFNMEKHLRNNLEPTLEIVSERVGDTSPLRRLTKEVKP